MSNTMFDYDLALKFNCISRYERLVVDHKNISFDRNTGEAILSRYRTQEVDPLTELRTLLVEPLRDMPEYEEAILETDNKPIYPVSGQQYMINQLWDVFYNLNSFFTKGNRYKFTISGTKLKLDKMGQERFFYLKDFKLYF